MTSYLYSDQEEAKKILVEILSKKEVVIDWIQNCADSFLNDIAKEWKIFCQSQLSTEQKHGILEFFERIEKYQETILEKIELYELMVQDRLNAFKILSCGDKKLKNTMESILLDWNKSVKTQLIFMYNKSEELMAGIKKIYNHLL